MDSEGRVDERNGRRQLVSARVATRIAIVDLLRT